MDHITIPIPQIIFKDLELNDYLNLFTKTNFDIFKGSGLTDIAIFEHDNYSHLFRKKPNQQIGAGFLSFLSSIAKKSLPWIKNVIFPEALNLTSTLIERHKNNPLKREEIKNLAKQSVKNIAEKTLKSTGGLRFRRGKKLKRKRIIKRNKKTLNKKNNKKRKRISISSKKRRTKKKIIKKLTIFDNV